MMCVTLGVLQILGDFVPVGLRFVPLPRRPRKVLGRSELLELGGRCIV
jgi:hypothetical protein